MKADPESVNGNFQSLSDDSKTNSRSKIINIIQPLHFYHRFYLKLVKLLQVQPW